MTRYGIRGGPKNDGDGRGADVRQVGQHGSLGRRRHNLFRSGTKTSAGARQAPPLPHEIDESIRWHTGCLAEISLPPAGPSEAKGPMRWIKIGLGCLGLVVAAAVQGCSSDATDDTRQGELVDSTFDASAETKAQYGISRWATRGDEEHIVISALDDVGSVVERFDSIVRPEGGDYQGTMTTMTEGSAELRYLLRADGTIEVEKNELGEFDRVRGIAGRLAMDVQGVTVGGARTNTSSHASSVHVLDLVTGNPTLVTSSGLMCKLVAMAAACVFAIGGDGDEGPRPIEPTGGGTSTSSCPTPPC